MKKINNKTSKGSVKAAAGGCPDMGRAVEGIVLFGLLSFVFAFGGFVMAGGEWDDAKKEVLIKTT